MSIGILKLLRALFGHGDAEVPWVRRFAAHAVAVPGIARVLGASTLFSNGSALPINNTDVISNLSDPHQKSDPLGEEREEKRP